MPALPYVIHSDGSISFPIKGPPPRCPDGFEPHPLDAYRFVLPYKPCIYRELNKEYICPTGKKKIAEAFCNLLNLPVERQYCFNCSKRLEKSLESVSIGGPAIIETDKGPIFSPTVSAVPTEDFKNELRLALHESLEQPDQKLSEEENVLPDGGQPNESKLPEESSES